MGMRMREEAWRRGRPSPLSSPLNSPAPRERRRSHLARRLRSPSRRLRSQLARRVSHLARRPSHLLNLLARRPRREASPHLPLVGLGCQQYRQLASGDQVLVLVVLLWHLDLEAAEAVVEEVVKAAGNESFAMRNTC